MTGTCLRQCPTPNGMNKKEKERNYIMTEMTRTAVNTHKMVLAAIFAAIMAVCAWISIPVLEIAFTMQTFAIFLALGVLGGKWGTVSILIYMLLGAVGMPVFSGFRGGPGVLFGVTGGYIMGFLGSGLVYWLITALAKEKPWSKLLGMVAGLLTCYAFGSAWFMVLYIQKGNAITLSAVLMTCVVPYLIPDGCKIALAWGLSQRLRKITRR